MKTKAVEIRSQAVSPWFIIAAVPSVAETDLESNGINIIPNATIKLIFIVLALRI
jgi:hypothetical protein